jgi:hypothetical protein
MRERLDPPFIASSNDASGVGHSRGYSNHHPSHCVIRARRGIVLGVGSQSDRVYLCCE